MTPGPRPALPRPVAFPRSRWRRTTRKCRRPPGARSRRRGEAEPRARRPSASGPPRGPPAPERQRPPPPVPLHPTATRPRPQAPPRGGAQPGPRTSAGRAGGAEEAGGKPGAANWGGGALPPPPPSVRALAAWPHLPGGLGATSRRRGPVPGAGGAWRCGREARASARRPGLRGQVMVGPCASPEERGPPEQLCPQAAPARRLDISPREVGQL